MIQIRGVSELHGATHQILSDRIEAGTYLCATAACGGEVRLLGALAAHLQDLLHKLQEAGVQVEEEGGSLRICAEGRLRAVNAETAPYPGFPTDLQAQWMAVSCTAEGTAVISENVFENRFMHAPELIRMGAHIELQRNTAVVRGVGQLRGAPLMATDLRASASLVIAALAARGKTTLSRVYHLDRGYELMEEKLRALGADARRVP